VSFFDLVPDKINQLTLYGIYSRDLSFLHLYFDFLFLIVLVVIAVLKQFLTSFLFDHLFILNEMDT